VFPLILAVAPQPVLVIAGVGNGSGTGAAVARLFAKEGYSVALVARGADSVKALANEITTAGGNAAPFPVSAYTPSDIASAFSSIRTHFPSPDFAIRAAVFNAGNGIWKPFLEITPDEISESLQVNVEAAFAFSREAILAFQGNDIEEPKGARGTLIFTGATASIRGNTTTSAFAAGKFGLRALSQSLAKEFGKQNIHVGHAIIDGGILTDRSRQRKDPEWENNPDVRLSAESIASSYLYLVNQDRSAWTWEIDLRPAHEKW